MEQFKIFFVSFSSRDKKYVREIMDALHGQKLEFWDYSNDIESIELGEVIDDRLIKQIDKCTHMIVLISENSMNHKIGHFCRHELEYALKKKSSQNIIFIPVLVCQNNKTELTAPYDVFRDTIYYELDSSPESIVGLTIKICRLIDHVYVPPIEAHPKMPFWRLFRDEIWEMAHSNRQHIDIMRMLGEFNEYYKKADMERALSLIKLFLSLCEYKIRTYRPFYPWIVKAVCETELAMYDEALKSYAEAGRINPLSQDVIGGIGTVYFKQHEYDKAAECFERIIKNNISEDISNARINLIITKQTMGKPISDEEENFLLGFDPEMYPDDLKAAIFNAQAVQYRIRNKYDILEKHCKEIIGRNLHDTVTIILLSLSYINRKMFKTAQQTILNAIDEAETNRRLDKNKLADHYKETLR